MNAILELTDGHSQGLEAKTRHIAEIVLGHLRPVFQHRARFDPADGQKALLDLGIVGRTKQAFQETLFRG